MKYLEIIDCNYEYDSYKYYKLIFNNIYIKDYIFCNFIKGYGKTLDQANISFIHIHKHWELFFYKVSIGSKFNNGINQVDLGKLLKSFKINCEKDIRYQSTLKRFYQINKYEIIQQFRINNKDVTDLISFFIELNEYSYLEYIYQDYYKDDEKWLTNVEVYKISNIYEKALTTGNIKMVEILYKLYKLPINLKESKYLYWSITSIKRDEMVKYLLDEMGYIVLTTYCGHFVNYYDYLMKLDHTLFSKIVNEFGSFKFFNTVVKENIYNYSKSIESINEIPKDYTNYVKGCYVPIKKIIDFIQNSIFSSIIVINSSNSSDESKRRQTISIHEKWLKKIQLLIKYNEIKDSNPHQLENIKKQIIQIEFEIDNVSSSYFKIVKLFFGFSSSSQSYESLPFQYTRSITKFDQFNLDREVKRIYIIDYLSLDYNDFLDKTLYLKFIINFSSYFNEYSLILQLYSFERKQHQTKLQILDGLSLDEITEDMFSILKKRYLSNCLHIATENASSKLLYFALDNFDKSLIDISTIGFNRTLVGYELFKCEHVQIDSQIEFLSKMVKLNVNFPINFQTVLNRILNGNCNLTNDHLDQIAKIIDNYYIVQKDNTSKSKYIDTTIFYHNDNNSNYFKDKKFITYDNIIKK